MQRKEFIINSVTCGMALHPFVRAISKSPLPFLPVEEYILKGPREPVFIYDNWSAYDELSDNIVLTEELAMRELNEIIRLKRNGVKIDYYDMDAFWFDKWGGYRTWHKEHWPNGPDKWINTCKENNINPGMWFSTNLIATHSGRFLEVIPEWKDSLGTDPNIMCLFDGGYLNHLSGTLQLWYDKGVRLFKFDFAYFEAATPAAKKKYSPGEILEKNKVAFMKMLQQFRARNNDVLITGYNGFGGEMENTFTPFKKTIDHRWMEIFDTIYCGDPRFSDVPMMNIWRSGDNYSDHMVRQFEFNGLPLRRIDNCAFMIGKTGTCYYRANHCWKGMLILELARGGWVNVYHGNLELLSDEDSKWFAKTQTMYHELQKQDNFSTFGEIPGNAKPYGFKAAGQKGSVCTVVNPSQQIATIELPVSSSSSKILYCDGGYKPSIKGNLLTLGAEQLAVVGFNRYADEMYNLGIDETIHIPYAISKADVLFKETGKNVIRATMKGITTGHIRIMFQQFDTNGLPHRSWGGSPPDGKKMDAFLKIKVTQNNKALPLKIEYDKMIWSGLSWAAGEIDAKDINADEPLNIECISFEQDELQLRANVYAVKYDDI
jgi:hypothetical protein